MSQGRGSRISARKQTGSAVSSLAAQPPELATSCARWIQAAAGGTRSTVRFAVPDRVGRLQVIAVAGKTDGVGRMRSNHRRTVLHTGRHVLLQFTAKKGFSLGIFPLEHHGEVLGVVEVLAPAPILDDRIDALLALVGQSALVLESARIRDETKRAIAGMNALVALASELVWARTATETVRMAVSASSQHLGTPIAGLLPDRDGWGWFVAAAEGFGERRRRSFRRAVRLDPDDPRPQRMRVPSLRRRFRDITESTDVVTVRAGAAVVLIADVPSGHRDFINGVASLLREVLLRFRHEAMRTPPGDAGEFSIAWTAHELKGPLAGARAALELVTASTPVPEGRELLRRTNEELGHLSDLIDPLLRWSAGAENLERTRVDLAQVTREAVASSALGADAGRVSTLAPEPIFVMGDPLHLRSAISNVVRNGLAYAPEDTRVSVRVEDEGRTARVVVKDRGPGVPAEERETLFSPFKRGRSGSRRPGSGMGLFIARRVLEAHGGSIHLRPTKAGATFVLELPADTSELAS